MLSKASLTAEAEELHTLDLQLDAELLFLQSFLLQTLTVFSLRGLELQPLLLCSRPEPL